MASIKSLVGKRISKTVKFMGEDVTISKLAVEEVLDIQSKAKEADAKAKAAEAAGNPAEDSNFDILSTAVRYGVEGGADLSDEDFQKFPLEELSKLTNDIMKFSGIGQDQGK